MIRVSPNWRVQEPDSSVGLLAIKGALNIPDHPELQNAKRALEEELRGRYAGMDRKTLREEPALAAYDAFYRRFRKSYHVQLQLESVVINFSFCAGNLHVYGRARNRTADCCSRF